MYKLLLAVKYLIHRPINLIGTIGIIVAVWALILVWSIFTGYIAEMRGHIRGTAADLSFLRNEYENSYPEVETLLEGTPGVRETAPRLSWYGLIDPYEPRRRAPGELDPAELAGKPASNFFQVVGIDVAAESRIRDFRADLDVSGENAALRVGDLDRPFDVETPNGGEALPGILVGLGRAEKKAWDLRQGDVLTLTTGQQAPAGHDEPVRTFSKRFRLSGVFTSRHFEFENSTVFVAIDVMRELLAPPGRDQAFNEVAISLEDSADPEAVRDALNARLVQTDTRGEVFAWQQRPRFTRFLENVDNQRGLMRIVLMVLMAVSCFLVFATLMMMVSEKNRDVGILASLGATRSGILTIFLLCGLAISVTGALLGAGLSWYTCLHLNDINDWITETFDVTLFPKNIYGLKRVPYELDPAWIATVIGIAIGATILFSVVPAWLASRKDPVQALRRE